MGVKAEEVLWSKSIKRHKLHYTTTVSDGHSRLLQLQPYGPDEEIQKEDCSSGMMEPETAEVMWKRSIELHNMRYTTFVGDGDSKAPDKEERQNPTAQMLTLSRKNA
ncbi:hypothetical protein ElyMa_004775500 [Elysia marginata]|uniref:Mutator-like transposase domain-containing protein n=1 Tax=Elysia marginata TaxID=1093978 RepID=A0AAV4IIV0_9GAST|nr:hypothetical protein ElyMa_004775500 [Elysia marginata]